MLGPNTNEGKKISQIMKDELTHHGMAKSHFLKHYPALQPWQLRLYKTREHIKTNGRKFYAVRVNRFKTKNRAENIGKDIRSKIGVDYRVLYRPINN